MRLLNGRLQPRPRPTLDSAAPLVTLRHEEPTPWASWPLWLVMMVVVGATLTAAGAGTALLGPGRHVDTAGREYLLYFVTRNLSLSLLLLFMLVVRARRPLAALMLLTALAQALDALTASVTGRFDLIPVDLVFAVVFAAGARWLLGPCLWRRATWQEPPPSRSGAATP